MTSTVHACGHGPSSGLSYGDEAATAPGTSPERVFKTPVAEVDGVLTVAVVPVAGSLDLEAPAAAASGKRAATADPAAAEQYRVRTRRHLPAGRAQGPAHGPG